ncbi:MAG: AtpZ/AtpI family protein [Saprospiraceae bacterium]|jgi:putative Ca2+/H+ antiporter (TMEM165/GDT1 family)|nr:AtpZ/AtpI family protein [Saprospiraceae bacterium]MBL0026451.1 AtpZ/AtpI family protein [Saprospiraceae bacterium]
MDPDLGEKKQKANAYLRYSGIAFQMAAVVALAIFAGKWLDTKFSLSKPVFTIVLVFLFFSGYMYKLYMELNKEK